MNKETNSFVEGLPRNQTPYYPHHKRMCRPRQPIQIHRRILNTQNIQKLGLTTQL